MADFVLGAVAAAWGLLPVECNGNILTLTRTDASVNNWQKINPNEGGKKAKQPGTEAPGRRKGCLAGKKPPVGKYTLCKMGLVPEHGAQKRPGCQEGENRDVRAKLHRRSGTINHSIQNRPGRHGAATSRPDSAKKADTQP